jgi:hypothetical protein
MHRLTVERLDILLVSGLRAGVAKPSAAFSRASGATL